MKQYILKRLVISIVTIWLIATSSFFLLRALPGNPFTTQQMMSPEMLSKMMRYYGLDRPLMEQYVTFMKNLLHGDFGYSLKYKVLFSPSRMSVRVPFLIKEISCKGKRSPLPSHLIRLSFLAQSR